MIPVVSLGVDGCCDARRQHALLAIAHEDARWLKNTEWARWQG